MEFNCYTLKLPPWHVQRGKYSFLSELYYFWGNTETPTLNFQQNMFDPYLYDMSKYILLFLYFKNSILSILFSKINIL